MCRIRVRRLDTNSVRKPEHFSVALHAQRVEVGGRQSRNVQNVQPYDRKTLTKYLPQNGLSRARHARVRV